MVLSILSKNIRYLRRKNDWSQEYIAQKLGYKSYTTIQKWEMGTSEPPLKKLKELAELFNVDINDLANKDLEMPVGVNSSTMEQLQKEFNLDDFSSNLVCEYLKLDLDQRKAIRDFFHEVLKLKEGTSYLDEVPETATKK